MEGVREFELTVWIRKAAGSSIWFRFRCIKTKWRLGVGGKGVCFLLGCRVSIPHSLQDIEPVHVPFGMLAFPHRELEFADPRVSGRALHRLHVRTSVGGKTCAKHIGIRTQSAEMPYLCTQGPRSNFRMNAQAAGILDGRRSRQRGGIPKQATVDGSSCAGATSFLLRPKGL